MNGCGRDVYIREPHEHQNTSDCRVHSQLIKPRIKTNHKTCTQVISEDHHQFPLWTHGIAPTIPDIPKVELVLDWVQALRRVIPQHAVDHDLFLALSVPRLAPKTTLGANDAQRHPEEGEDGHEDRPAALDDLHEFG